MDGKTLNSMKISIITATYNSGKTVRDTIESVCRQSFHNIEYIVKDGGSKDNTLEICSEYESRLGRSMKIISAPDNGIYDAMNIGLEAATGDVIGILNSDDFFTSDDVIERVAQAFDNDKSLDAVYGDIHFVKDENLDKCSRYYSSRYFRPWLLRFGFMPAHPSFYCKKAVFDKYGLYDLQYTTSSDFEMMVRLLWNNQIKTKYINMDFVTMRTGGESTAGLASKRKVNNDISRSLTTHGIYTNQALQAVRYAWRICEMIYTKIKY